VCENKENNEYILKEMKKKNLVKNNQMHFSPQTNWKKYDNQTTKPKKSHEHNKSH
jgi:hypothetical protein